MSSRSRSGRAPNNRGQCAVLRPSSLGEDLSTILPKHQCCLSQMDQRLKRCLCFLGARASFGKAARLSETQPPPCLASRRCSGDDDAHTLPQAFLLRPQESLRLIRHCFRDYRLLIPSLEGFIVAPFPSTQETT